MLLTHTEKLLAQASAEVLARIAADEARASKRVASLLEIIRLNLFDSTLDVQRLKRTAGISGNAISSKFHQEVGLPPKSYITDCRLVVASRLLQETDLQIWKIGTLVGYSGLPLFSQAFSKWSGISPTKFRASIGDLPTGIRKKMDDTVLLRKALRGELPPEESQPLMLYLHSLYSGADSEERPSADIQPMPEGLALEQLRAQSVWKHIRDLPLVDQKRYVRDSVAFGSSALFELLLRKSRELGRRNRQLGVEIAEVGLESLHGIVRDAPVGLSNLFARGWAWLGNARRLALEFESSAKAFLAAEECWETPRLVYDWRVRAEMLALRSSLAVFQGRFEEASGWVDESVGILRKVSTSRLLAQCLVQRAVVTMVSSSSNSKAVEDLEDAHTIAEGSGDERLSLIICTNFTLLQTICCEFDKAQGQLRKAKKLCAVVGDVLIHNQLVWLQGLIDLGRGACHSGEQALLKCRDKFLALGEAHHAALASLDLALYYLGRGELTRAIALAAEVVPVLDQCGRDSERALMLLQNAVARKKITASILREIRSVCLRHIV